jgi:hypothetical protein
MNLKLIPRKRAPRRELEPMEPLDAKDGPKMQALPSDRHRAFVRALYTVRPGHSAAVKAAKMAGFGTAVSSASSMATIASRLRHDERILEAIEEEDKKFIRASAPRALGALSRLIEDPRHKDHARGIGMVLDRVIPVEQVHNVKHQHDVTPAFQNTAEIMARMAELAARFGAPMPSLPAPVIIENDEVQPCG